MLVCRAALYKRLHGTGFQEIYPEWDKGALPSVFARWAAVDALSYILLIRFKASPRSKSSTNQSKPCFIGTHTVRWVDEFLEASARLDAVLDDVKVNSSKQQLVHTFLSSH